MKSMLLNTSLLPEYNFSPELNAQYLRKVLQLMVKHQVPATPINYAIWYEFVSERNPELTSIVNQLLSENKELDAKLSLELYKNYIFNNSTESFEKINQQIQKIISQTSNNLKETHAQADVAKLNLEKNTSDLEKITTPSELNETIQAIVEETKLLTNATIAMQAKLDETHQELEQMRRELTEVKQIAVTDALTGLLNRRAFDQTLTTQLEKNNQQPLCLAILDIDHFKRVNDTYGHVVGDNVIKYVAKVMQKHAKNNHHVARYGGEEMAIIMPGTDQLEALLLAESIREDMEKSLLKKKDNSEGLGKITVSIGVSILQDEDNPETLIVRADQALYKAKANGRNQVILTD